jgi:hypothetical protein
VVTLAAENLQPVVPSRGDKVKVILGDEDKDQTGQLLSIDSQVTRMEGGRGDLQKLKVKRRDISLYLDKI